MKIGDVCRRTGLTKKAVEYYQRKGLIEPGAYESGYRDFTENQVEILHQIAVLRKLGLNIDEIRGILNAAQIGIGDVRAALEQIRTRKARAVEFEIRRMELLERYIGGEAPELLEQELSLLEQKTTIVEKLRLAFPGYYGAYIAVHFGRFLRRPVQGREQENAYAAILRFLDDMPAMEIPDELKSLLENLDAGLTEEQMGRMSEGMETAMEDFDAFWEENRGMVKAYAAYRASDEFAESPMARLAELLQSFCHSSGYYETFIPLMRCLSPSYDDYQRKLLAANDALLTRLSEESEEDGKNYSIK